MPKRAPNPRPLPAPPAALAGAELSQWVLHACTHHLGFAAAGLCDAAPISFGPQLRNWLAQGRHGDMAYLADQLDARLDPARELPGVASIIMVADRYAARTSAPTSASASAPTSAPTPPTALQGRLARYAQGRDYHQVIKRRLHRLADALRETFPDQHFRSFVDTAPVLEREHAARAGLGWIGKHTLLIHPRGGSYTLLGGVLTTLPLPTPPDHAPTPDACGSCTRCIDACPTHAITPYSVDARRCISYLTIEHQGLIDPALQPAMGNWLAGCDICQDVCPHNSPRPSNDPQHAHVNPDYAPIHQPFNLLEVLGWSADDRTRTLGRSALKRATLGMLKRNAIIALGNALAQAPNASAPTADAASILARLQHANTDPHEDPLVRATAQQVLARV